MALDNAKNFAKVIVSTGYDASATSIVLQTGDGAKLPTVPFNAVWYNSTDYTDPSDDPNVEIVRVTARSTDTLTVTRAQEGTSASTKNTSAKTYKMIAGLTAKVINTDIEDDFLSAIAALGSSIKAYPLIQRHINNATTLTDGSIFFVPVYIKRLTTITGVKFYQSTQGNYTADNNNKVGLYSYSGGTLTLVASCGNDGNLWKGSANTFQTKAFSATYDAAPGIYFIALLYNNSAVTTTPQIGTTLGYVNANASAYDFTNSANLNPTLTSQTDLPASQAMSGTTKGANNYWAALY